MKSNKIIRRGTKWNRGVDINMRTPYFELGTLTLEYEKTLVEFDNIPLLFTCRSDDGRGYLCLCNSVSNFRWLIAECDADILSELVNQQISIYDAFRESHAPYYIVTEKIGEEPYYCVKEWEQAKSELPDPALMLDPDLLEIV